MSTNETITIKNCPLCGADHVYGLTVERSTIVTLAPSDQRADRPHGVEFTRLFTCPTKSATFEAKFTLYDTQSSHITSVIDTQGPPGGPTEPQSPTIGGSVVADQAIAITPHNAALYEAGKKLLLDSVSIGQDFCKLMIGLANGAIPIYAGLLTLILPKGFAFGSFEGFVLVIPAFLFLLAGI